MCFDFVGLERVLYGQVNGPTQNVSLAFALSVLPFPILFPVNILIRFTSTPLKVHPSLAHNTSSEHHLPSAAASGSPSVRLWNLSIPKASNKPFASACRALASWLLRLG